MKTFKKLITVLMVLMMLSGCTSRTKQYAAYTVYPIGYLLNRIGGNRIVTESIQTDELVQVSTLKENYQEILDDSYVLFHIGGLEPYMDLYDSEIIADGISLTAGDLSVLNYVYDYKRYTPVYVDGKVNYVEGSFYEGDAFDTVDYYDYDPFIWLSPSGMLSLATSINDYLSANYMEQSAYFNENYEILSDELITLDAAYMSLANSLVSENKTIKFVSMTGSFSCWQKDFNIQVYPVCMSKYGAMPTEAQLQIIKNKINADNVKYIVYEPNLPDDMLQLFVSLEEELGLKRITLNNISSLTASQAEQGKDYLTLMYENLSILENISEPVSGSSETVSDTVAESISDTSSAGGQ
ncbi:MAG: zinc ABC transporter substrate-binding protein [Erysipelotrichaceae bacterium]|nr:zinc ABC transporter substrate-binding protein [Erysipelotrichaceae bacterium]